MKESVRKNDLVARIGGDEFMILLKGTSEKNVKIIGEKIRQSIKLDSITGEDTNITCIIGIGVVNENNDNINQIIERVDNTLYFSNINGRNTVTAYLKYNCYKVMLLILHIF